jgi:dihydrofolate reductase
LRRDFSDIFVTNSLENALEIATSKNVLILGGAKVYDEALKRAAELDIDTIFATEIHGEFTGDAFFPVIPNTWQEISRRDFPADEKNKFPYTFVTYSRKI